LAAADVAKTLQLADDIDAVENYYGYLGTAKVPSWMAYDLFAVFPPKNRPPPVSFAKLFFAVSLLGINAKGIFGTITLIPACLFLHQGKLDPWIFGFPRF
jgi:hypothetical protein